MALRAVEHLFTGATTPYSAYDSTKTTLGDLIFQYTGTGAKDKYAGPLRFGRDADLTAHYGLARPNETSVAVPGTYPHVVKWCDKRSYYTTGTVSASGTAVTGSGTSWLSGGIVIGARIGFGTTEQGEVTTWYNISAIGSDTSITLENSAGTIAGGTSYVIHNAVEKDYMFLADIATAAATRRISMFEYNRRTSMFAWKGFITQTYPAATNHTIVGMRTVYKTYTTGTVGVSTATVTGSGTAWSASRINIGSRIGFGSTDPAQISMWYYINAVGSDTSITIQLNVTASGTGGTATNLSIAGGTSYVIEDLRVLTTTTNATATNGGLYMTMGLSIDDFTPAGTTIAAATTVDKVKACYWLADAGTVTNDAGSGVALDDFDSWTQQYCYVLERVAATTPSVYKYNIRTALGSISSGKTTSAFVFATATQAVTGNTAATNNGRIGTLSHGPGSGVKSLYFATTTRIYRAAVTGITNGSSTWLSDSMVEVPTGGASTYNASSVLTSVEISDQIDRLVITGTGAGTIPANNRAFVTQYNSISTPFDRVFLVDTRQIDQSTASNDLCPVPNPQGAVLNVWSEAGVLYISRTGTTSLTNQVYAIPIGADWDFADIEPEQRLISPAILTTNAEKLKRVIVNCEQFMGGGAHMLPTEGYRLYYRTSGISDDSGAWTLVNDTGDISAAAPSTHIQFMFEFRTIGSFCLPSRIFGITCTYEDNTTDSHYQPSIAQSNTTDKRFAWRFSTAFGGTVPTLRIRLFNAVTGSVLLDDTTSASTEGTWEKSTNDGGAWGAYDTTDKGNETTYIRYTPTSLADNIKVRALITQN